MVSLQSNEVKEYLRQCQAAITEMTGVTVELVCTVNKILDSVDKRQFLGDVCILLNINYEVLVSETQERKYVEPRHLIAFMLKQRSTLNDEEISKLLHRERSTISSGIKGITNLITAGDASVTDKYIQIHQMVKKYEPVMFA